MQRTLLLPMLVAVAALMAWQLLPNPTLTAAPEQGQGPIEGDEVHLDRLDLGTHWYGSQIERSDLFGKVVLVELWGS